MKMTGVRRTTCSLFHGFKQASSRGFISGTIEVCVQSRNESQIDDRVILPNRGHDRLPSDSVPDSVPDSELGCRLTPGRCQRECQNANLMTRQKTARAQKFFFRIRKPPFRAENGVNQRNRASTQLTNT